MGLLPTSTKVKDDPAQTQASAMLPSWRLASFGEPGSPPIWRLASFGENSMLPDWRLASFGESATLPSWRLASFGESLMPPFWRLASFGARLTSGRAWEKRIGLWPEKTARSALSPQIAPNTLRVRRALRELASFGAVGHWVRSARV
jgi:hypothetical protein